MPFNRGIVNVLGLLATPSDTRHHVTSAKAAPILERTGCQAPSAVSGNAFHDLAHCLVASDDYIPIFIGPKLDPFLLGAEVLPRLPIDRHLLHPLPGGMG